eukprot:CAMPEP_0173100298 /NCGR_PEP_ID=MMETSP1102-20130122/36116_1 /TAXON_ID=49646 /ORGANISM="Geminigera sp., Strain Caron Lab Isolate" /LENGTH=70 /DNA_ID=CAMNT_0013993705 /DNA_START=180 /DNA_END=392 /DNA_ORIENTATION=+
MNMRAPNTSCPATRFGSSWSSTRGHDVVSFRVRLGEYPVGRVAHAHLAGGVVTVDEGAARRSCLFNCDGR